MEEGNELIPGELDKVIAWFQAVFTIIVFFAGFVFVTIPLVIFSSDVSSLYGRLALYWLMASLLLFTVVIDIYTAAVRQLCIETIPRAFGVLRRIMLGRGKADQLVGMAMFFASASISFMLLIKGQELMIEAIVWFLVSIGRPIFGHLVIHRHPK